MSKVTPEEVADRQTLWLYEAAEGDDAAAVAEALDAGADPARVMAHERRPGPYAPYATPLAYAAACGSPAALAAMLARTGGTDAAREEVEGANALHAAALNCRPECVELLLAAGADANASLRDGRTALDLVDKYRGTLKSNRERIRRALMAAGGKRRHQLEQQAA